MSAIYRFIFVLWLLVLPLIICPADGFAVMTALAVGGIGYSVFNLGGHAKEQFTRIHEIEQFQEQLLKVTHSIDKELDMDKRDAAAKLEIEAQLAILVQIYTHCSSYENNADLMPAVIAKFKQVLSKYDQLSGVEIGLEELTLEELLTEVEKGAKTTWNKTTLLMAMRTLGFFVHRTASTLGGALKSGRGDAAVVAAMLKVVQAYKEHGAQIRPGSDLKDTADSKMSAKTAGKWRSVGNECDRTAPHIVGYRPTHLRTIRQCSDDCCEHSYGVFRPDWPVWA